MVENVCLSIVTVVLNGADEITSTIDSINHAKKHINIEYIVVDGGSVDGTLNILKCFQDIIDIQHVAQDDGLYDAMNTGAHLASGTHILYLNAGDVLLYDNFIAEMRRTDLDPECFYYSDLIKTTLSDGAECDSLIKGSSSKLFWDMTLNHPTILTPLKIMQREKFNLVYSIAADYEFFLRVKKRYNPYFVKLTLPISKMAPNGVSSDTAKSLSERRKIQRMYYGTFYAYIRYFLSHIKNITKGIVNL